MTTLDPASSNAMSDAGVQVLDAPPIMDLPPGAVLNDDATVTLTLGEPFDLRFRVSATEPIQVEHFDCLVLRRLTGADVRRIIGASNPLRPAMALSLGFSLKRLALIENVIDARDEIAARDVVSELLGGMALGLPPHADQTPEGIRLPLHRSVPTEGDGCLHNLVFRKITAAQRQQIVRSNAILDWGVALSTGMSPRQAKSMIDAADGADAMAMNMVVLFVCGATRTAAG